MTSGMQSDRTAQDGFAVGGRKTFSSLWQGICRSSVVRRLRSRRARRGLVIVSILILALMPLVGLWTGEIWWVASLLAPYFVANVLLAAATGGLFERKMSSLDERERSVRLTALREPYVTGVTIGILAGWIGLGALQSDVGWSLGVSLAILASVYLIPTKVLAWKLPNELVDDE